MIHNVFESSFPSARRELLDRFVGKKVMNMIRYSWWNGEASAANCEIEKEDVFSLTVGPLCIEFESDLSIGFSSHVEISSITFWAETIDGEENPDLMKNDNELFPVEAADDEYSKVYFKNLVGHSITKYEIIKLETTNPLQWDHPREVGLIFYFSNGSQLVLAHQLTTVVPDDFTVLRWDQVSKEVYPQLYKMSEFWN
ncbi:hypothetical protein [Gorillibacterium sp. CAU 1737]|uniref:hypothetical protein n=1 Tax=Gorillibacterium sp. CAU 1737 TaxID=3140362 RepID=UPI0032606193